MMTESLGAKVSISEKNVFVEISLRQYRYHTLLFKMTVAAAESGSGGSGEHKVAEEEREAAVAAECSLNDGFCEEESVVLEDGAKAVPENKPSDDFVNEGFRRWEENRAAWLQLGSEGETSTSASAVAIDVDSIIDVIFSQRWRTQNEDSLFPQPVPLPQMVDILEDLWEAEGLDV